MAAFLSYYRVSPVNLVRRPRIPSNVCKAHVVGSLVLRYPTLALAVGVIWLQATPIRSAIL
jgi:hypothetical protein